jgi:hypothetical protein
MRVLLIGDIVGDPGKKAVDELLNAIVTEYGIDFTVANAENAAADGFGLTEKIARELLDAGIHVLTSGNHIWDKLQIVPFIENSGNLLRPANFPQEAPGRGSAIIENAHHKRIAVLNLAGRVFMESLDCPFKAALREIETLHKTARVIIVDMHAEATAEKIAMGRFLDGTVSAVLGTHTHVQTADETILPHGTAYITDVGMTGALDSVIGINSEAVLRRFLTQMPVPFRMADNDLQLQGAVVEIDETSGNSIRINRIKRSIVQK